MAIAENGGDHPGVQPEKGGEADEQAPPRHLTGGAILNFTQNAAASDDASVEIP